MTARPRLALTRDQVLAFRRRTGALDARLPAGAASLRHAAWAGLQDSMPRAALLSIHARVEGAGPETWEDPALVQVWGPRFSAYVVPAQDRAVFTLGRLPDDDKGRARAVALAERLEAFLDGQAMPYAEAGRGLGVQPNELRYAAPTGRVLIRWDGARKPMLWVVPTPDGDPATARLELVRRFLHVFGPATAASFAVWAGISPGRAETAFEVLGGELLPTRTPIGDGWLLTRDEASVRAPAGSAAAARLLPSGDAYTLLHGADRDLVVPEADRRASLWPSRVWPGAVLVDGGLVGTWRRAGQVVSIESWLPLTPAERAAVDTEARALPLPHAAGRINVRWSA